MKPKHKRLTFVVVALALLGAATGLVLSAFQDSIVFFYGPTDEAQKDPGPDRSIRLGSLVEKGSVKKPGGAEVLFTVTDGKTSIPVTYTGILPDLFREGQGVVAEGHLVNGELHADDVLAKHDEKYMPPEVVEALKKSGEWQRRQTATQ